MTETKRRIELLSFNGHHVQICLNACTCENEADYYSVEFDGIVMFYTYDSFFADILFEMSMDHIKDYIR